MAQNARKGEKINFKSVNPIVRNKVLNRTSVYTKSSSMGGTEVVYKMEYILI